MGCDWIDDVPERNLRDTLRMNVALRRRAEGQAEARIAELEEALHEAGESLLSAFEGLKEAKARIAELEARDVTTVCVGGHKGHPVPGTDRCVICAAPAHLLFGLGATRGELKAAKARIEELEDGLRVNGTGHCCEAGPEGAVCALPTGHGGAHEAGPIVWIG